MMGPRMKTTNPLSSNALYSPMAGVNTSMSGKEIRTHITIIDAAAVMMSPNFSF